MTKKKRLTQREKAMNASLKKELQEEGILPPDKPKLNRKKFAQEVMTEFKENMMDYGDEQYLYRAIGCMVSAEMRRVTPEEVGVLKFLKIAVETKKFERNLKEFEGRTTYTIGEYVEKVITPVLRL